MNRLVAYLMLAILLSAPALCAPAGKSRVDPGKVRHELRQILSSPEYNRTYKKGYFERLKERIGKAISDAIGGFFKWVLHHLNIPDAAGKSILATLGSWLVVLGFLAAVVLVIRKIVGNAGERLSDGGGEDVSYELPNARALIRQAAKLAETGDYRGAFKCAYVASIACLDEARALRFERSRTNWEYMRELKSGGHERSYGELQPLTQDFDRKIYGREVCCEGDYLKAVGAFDRLSSEEAK